MVTEPAPDSGTLSPDVAASEPQPWSPTSNGHPVVELRGIGRTYGSDPPVQALRGVDLTIHAGDWLAVVGPSGSGKSTLLNVLGCLDRPTAGTYLIEGIDAAALSEDERASMRARSIGFVFQTFHLLGHRTALENVMLADIYAAGNRIDRQARAHAALEKVGMGHRRDFLPTKLSGGEQQRVAIARAFVNRPQVLLADEPTGNLDPDTSQDIMLLLERINRTGTTVLMATHDHSIVDSMRRRVVELDLGTVVRDDARGVYGVGR
jgi:ABC-type lipoprotein export system ATPase subunit